LHLEDVTQKVDEESPALYQWTQVKQELLAGAFGVQNPGFMVTNGHYFISNIDLLSTGPITIHKIDRFYRDWNYGFFVFKEKWSRTELEDIVTDGYYWRGESIWMLPNINKMLSEEEAQELWAIVDVMSLCEPLDCNLLNIKENGLEAIGCFDDYGSSILWTNPSTPEKLDLVVNNLKQLCLYLKVELKEI